MWWIVPTMKLRELIFEMPRKILDGSINTNAINREFSLICTVGDIRVMIDRSNTLVIGLGSDKARPDGRVLPAFRLIFKQKHELNFTHNLQKVVQVDKVAIRSALGNSGIMSGVYRLLADLGFALVSDNTQFEPAQAMWIKLANDPNYVVRVADVDHGFFKDRGGNAIVYDGKRLLDDQVWTSGSNFDGQYRLLILTKE